MFLYLIILVLTLLMVQYWKKVNYFKKRGIPNVMQLPFGGIEFMFQDLDKIRLKRRQKYGLVYGDFMGSLPIIMVSDPEIAKEVTIKHAHNFTDTQPIRLNIKYFKDTFFMKKGREWKEGRSVVSPVFTTRKIKDIFSQFQVASKPLFENIEELIREGKQNEIDIRALLKNYGLDVIAKFVFQISINSAKEKDNKFVQNVLRLINFNNVKFVILLNFVPRFMMEKLDFKIFDADAMEYLADLIRTIIKQRKENQDQNYNDFLDLLLKTIREKELDVPEQEIIGLCILFFFAGLETVSLTISNVLYSLILNPDCQAKLHSELSNLFSDKELNYERINESKYLDAILKESQRVYPVVTVLFRIAEQAMQIKDLKIEANDLIGIDVYSMHHCEDYWPDVEQFRPERFYERDTKFEGDDVFKPFGTGIRACIATRFAVLQVKYVIAKIILEYEVYRTEKTSVPPKYVKNPQQLSYANMYLGFRRREN